MNKEDKIKRFNPDENINRDNNIFGLPFNANESKVILIPVPWDVTTSNCTGAALAPEAIFEASFHIDLHDEFVRDAWKYGISMEYTNEYWLKKNSLLRANAREFIQYLENKSKDINARKLRHLRRNINEINRESKKLNNWVKDVSGTFLKQKKIVGIIGGDHSSSLGLMQALAGKNESFSILQIDAHADLRRNYEFFQFSHASAMYNATQIPQVSKLVQVGIRDYCEEEYHRINNSNSRIVTYSDRLIKHRLYHGHKWCELTDEIINQLGENIYISFDIDGLNPALCPHTGTPVPGGFDFEETAFLLEKCVEKKKRIIGFDLCEVIPDSSGWDAYVAAKVLYKLSILSAKSE